MDSFNINTFLYCMYHGTHNDKQSHKTTLNLRRKLYFINLEVGHPRFVV